LGHHHGDFSNHVGDAFRLAGSPQIEWRLVHVGELRRSADFESYSIEFETTPIDGSQGTVTLEHRELGTLELFVVAIAPGRYEAVFNQLVGSEA